MITNCAKFGESIYRGAYWEASTPATFLLLGHHLQGWPNIKPAVGQHGVFSGQRIPNLKPVVRIQRQLKRHLLM